MNDELTPPQSPRAKRITFTPREEVNRLKAIHLVALEIALAELGEGEVEGNNDSEFIRYIRSTDSTGRGPGGSGPWCASYVSSLFTRSCVQLGLVLPIRTSRSAQRLYKRVGGYGSFVDKPAPGDLICWRRGAVTSWQGHVGLVEKIEGDTCHTVEGNRGKFPSVVARYTYSLRRERQRKLLGFSRLYT